MFDTQGAGLVHACGYGGGTVHRTVSFVAGPTTACVCGQWLLILTRLFLICLCISLLSAFTVPSPHELRRDFAAELKKIKESTPGAKALARWNKLRDQAVKALEQAEINGASEFASTEYEEAVDLFQRARDYAAQRSYKKASYLAAKTEEIARSASESALKARARIEKKLYSKLEHLKSRLDMLHQRLPYESGLSESLAELYLQWSDIRHCVALGLYARAQSMIPALSSAIDQFQKQSAIQIDQEQENWEDTI